MAWPVAEEKGLPLHRAGSCGKKAPSHLVPRKQDHGASMLDFQVSPETPATGDLEKELLGSPGLGKEALVGGGAHWREATAQLVENFRGAPGPGTSSP